MKYKRQNYGENKKRYGVFLAEIINKDDLDFIDKMIAKNSIDHMSQKPKKFQFKTDYYERPKESVSIIRKLLFLNKLIGTSQKIYKLRQ
jgi:hypothetical protein